MHGSRGCFGHCVKPSTIMSVDEPSKELRIEDQAANTSSVSDDFWRTSDGEMDNSAVQTQSQGSISSISTLNQPLDSSSIACSASNPSEFLNHGLLLWNQTRQKWHGNGRSQKRTQAREPTISWNATYESLLGTNKPFPRAVPLAEMVDFLVDTWEQEGLYD